MDTSVLRLSVPEILGLYKSGKLSPVEVAESCLRQIVKYNPAFNAICCMDEKLSLRQAQASEKRWKRGEPQGALDGIPVTIKDWFDVKGWPTRYGSKASSDIRQPADSPFVARLREQGAIILGKTTLPEFGHKGVTDSPLTGVTRNPWNAAKTPGGSSGGAAVAAATGMAFLNIGSDAGGSVRLPASFSGVVGFKPSPGLVPSWPPSIFSSLSAQGPLTRCVADAAAALDVMMLPDARDWNALPLPPPQLSAALKKTLPKLRIAYAPTMGVVPTAKNVLEVFAEKGKLFQSLGPVEEITVKSPHMADVFIKHWIAAAAAHVASLPPAQRKLLDPHYLNWAKMGDGLHLRDYIDAQQERMVIGAYFKSILDSYDLLITPTMPMTAFETGVDMPRETRAKGTIWTPLTLPANLAKLPAVSLPLGLAQDGMPVGVQIMGGYLKDALVMQAAKRLEEEIAFEGWLDRNG